MMMMASHPPLSSPTISSVSSSDLDTESSGSFFPDRSISLGALMGVTTSFPAITFRTPPRRRDATPVITRVSTVNSRNVVGRKRKRLRRKKWWWLCSGEASKPSSLGEFLEIERRFEAEMLFSDALMDVNFSHHHRNGGRMLFRDGRVLPPPPPSHVSDVNDGTLSICSLCRFPGLLCGGGSDEGVGGVRSSIKL